MFNWITTSAQQTFEDSIKRIEPTDTQTLVESSTPNKPAETWRTIESDEDYEEWKAFEMENFMEKFSLEEHDKGRLLAKESFEKVLEAHSESYIGYDEINDSQNWNLLKPCLKDLHSDEFENIHELAEPAFNHEARRFWFELLKMQEDPNYITEYEHCEAMWYLAGYAPYRFVNYTPNVMAAILDSTADIRDICSDYWEAKDEIARQEVERQYQRLASEEVDNLYSKIKELKEEYKAHYHEEHSELIKKLKNMMPNYTNSEIMTSIIINAEWRLKEIRKAMMIDQDPLENFLGSVFGSIPEEYRFPAEIALWTLLIMGFIGICVLANGLHAK